MWQLRICSVNIFGSIQGCADRRKRIFMVSASHSLRSVFYAFRVGSYEVEKSKRRVISWVDRHICGVLVSLAASNLGMKGCLLCLIGVFSTVSFLYSCVFYDPEILL